MCALTTSCALGAIAIFRLTANSIDKKQKTMLYFFPIVDSSPRLGRVTRKGSKGR
jgi:hypothetical protein